MSVDDHPLSVDGGLFSFTDSLILEPDTGMQMAQINKITSKIMIKSKLI